MYRINFYDQSTVTTDKSSRMLGGPLIVRTPDNVSIENITNTVDSFFHNKPSRFEEALHEEILSLKNRSKTLEEKIRAAASIVPSAEEKIELVKEYSLLKRSKETLALVVEQMQKCTANILANFR